MNSPRLIGKPFGLSLVVGIILAFCALSPAALPQVPGAMAGGTGRLVVRVMSITGGTIPVATVNLYADMGELTGNSAAMHMEGSDYIYVFNFVSPGRYAVTVSVAGFQTSRQTIELTSDILIQELVFLLKPIGSNADAANIPPSLVFTPKAQKETQTALKELQSKDIVNAQKHLITALKASPGNSQINYLLGMTYVWMNDSPKGKPYLEKAVSLNPKYYDALQGLGYLRFQDGDFAGAVEVLERAIPLSPTAWQPHLTLAYAYLRQKNFAKAREHADRALELGREKAVGVQLAQVEALAGLGEMEQASKVLGAYLKDNPRDYKAKKLETWLAKLNSPAQTTATAGPVDTALPLGDSGTGPLDKIIAPPATRDTWGPPDSDATQPPVAVGRECSLPKVLAGAGKRAEELVNNLEQFSALEKYESVEIRAKGQVSDSTSKVFNYMVFIHKDVPGLLSVEEQREQDKVTELLPGRLQDVGSPGVFLIFHPLFRDDFEMKCEGLGQWNGQGTWLVHFQQLPDKTPRIREFVSGQKGYPMRLRGRAWISAETYQVLHLETDLLQPVPEIQLHREHMSVDYQVVPFSKHKVELWLPQQVDLYIDFRGHLYHHYHSFTDFRLNAVDVEHKVSKPKSSP